MASPGLESFCCLFANTSAKDDIGHKFGHADISSRGLDIYNSTCLVSSSVSILGAVYQLWPKVDLAVPKGKKEKEGFLRQCDIICWLALADLLASIGVLVRSALWIANYIPMQHDPNPGSVDFAHVFCAVSSGWIQYFFICTYFWTFFYAFDTYLISQGKDGYPLFYHMMSWAVTALITGGGLIPLYVPDLMYCEHNIGNLVPHYLSTYLPILVVLIGNPILYSKTSDKVRENLMNRGRYTDRERKIVRAINKKFLLVILVFYICWLPNILNGVLLMFWKHVQPEVFLGLWQFMGVVNPVQALLNTLVYRGSGGLKCRRADDDSSGGKNHVQDSTTEDSTEHSPLLSFRR